MDTWGAGYADGDCFDVDHIYRYCSGMLDFNPFWNENGGLEIILNVVW